MTGSTGRIEIYYGAEPTDPTERRLMARLEADLRRWGGDAVVLANFSVGRRHLQIDLVVATPTAAVVVEVKGYRSAVRGGLNGAWVLAGDGGAERRLGERNPVMQAEQARFAVADRMSELTGVEDVRGGLSALVCLFPEAPMGTDLPDGTYKAWVGGYARLWELLARPSSRPIDLAAWRRLAAALDLSLREDLALSPEEAVVANYRARFHDLGQALSEPMAPTVVTRGEEVLDLEAVQAGLDAGWCAQIVGGSGSGKTLFLDALGRAANRSGFVCLTVPARHFNGRLAPLLVQAVASGTDAAPGALLSAAAASGAPVLVLVDGWNECPLDRAPELVRALHAARLRWGLQVVIAGQAPVDLPAALQGPVLGLAQPDRAQAEAIVSARLGRPLDNREAASLDIVATAHDAAVLAAVIRDPGASDGRHALYAAFARHRLGKADDGAHRALADLASYMRTRFVSVLPRSVLTRRLRRLDPPPAAADGLARRLIGSGLVVAEGERVRFRHDLFADFYAAEQVLGEHGEPAALAAATARPINVELDEFIVGGCDGAAELEALLNGASPRLLAACLRGACGSRARAAVLDRCRLLMERIAGRYAEVRFGLPRAPGPDDVFLGPDLVAAPRTILSSVEERVLQVLPLAVGEGLLPDILALLRDMSVRMRAEASRLAAHYPAVAFDWTVAVLDEVFGAPRHAELTDVHHLLQSTKVTLFDRRSHEALFPVVKAAVDATSDHEVGELVFLFEAMMAFDDFASPPPASFLAVVEAAWKTEVYLLRALVTDVALRFGDRLPEPGQDRLAELLGGFLNDEVLLNSFLFDALGALGALDDELDVDAALAAFTDALALPDGEAAGREALVLFGWMTEHPYAAAYAEAFLDHLDETQRQRIRARAFEVVEHYSLTRAHLAADLFASPTRAALAALREAAAAPATDVLSVQDAIGVYIHAVGALARLGEPLPSPDAAPGSAAEAWARVGALVYQMNRPDPDPQAVAAAWDAFERLGAALVLDPIDHLLSDRAYHIQADVAFADRFAEGLARLARTALEPDFEPVVLFERSSPRLTDGFRLRRLALEVLGLGARPSDMARIQAWLDDPKLGSIALAAARQIEKAAAGKA